MIGISQRMAAGFIVAVVSVLIFHQGVWALLHFLDIPGYGMPPPFPTDHVGPLGVPRIVSLCFWGGVWGALFGAFWRDAEGPSWRRGLVLGIAAALFGMFVVAALKGLPIGGNWQVTNWAKSFLINGIWGVGVGLMLGKYLGGFAEREVPVRH